MTAADIAREAQWATMKEICAVLLSRRADSQPAKPSPFPASVRDHPAFTRRFNARLVAVGMAATNGHRRLIR